MIVDETASMESLNPVATAVATITSTIASVPVSTTTTTVASFPSSVVIQSPMSMPIDEICEPVMTPIEIKQPQIAASPVPAAPTQQQLQQQLQQQVQQQQQQQQQQKKLTTSHIGGKPVAVVKSSAAQSLLQSNQQHFPHHQIQVSTSAGLQTIRLSGHSVLHSAQTVPATTTASVGNQQSNVTAIFPTAKIQSQQQQTIVTNQPGKSILQATNLKQHQQHVLPGKTLLASQIKLVSSGQIKSLLTSHGLQGQTIFIKQSSPATAQAQQVQQQQIKVCERFVFFLCLLFL